MRNYNKIWLWCSLGVIRHLMTYINNYKKRISKLNGCVLIMILLIVHCWTKFLLHLIFKCLHKIKKQGNHCQYRHHCHQQNHKKKNKKLKQKSFNLLINHLFSQNASSAVRTLTQMWARKRNYKVTSNTRSSVDTIHFTKCASKTGWREKLIVLYVKRKLMWRS